MGGSNERRLPGASLPYSPDALIRHGLVAHVKFLFNRDKRRALAKKAEPLKPEIIETGLADKKWVAECEAVLTRMRFAKEKKEYRTAELELQVLLAKKKLIRFKIGEV